MDINEKSNIMTSITNLDEKKMTDIEMSFHLVSKEKHSANYYRSSNVLLDEEVNKWLVENIIKSLADLKQNNEEKDAFMVGDYNHELKVNDLIARCDLASLNLVDRKKQLYESIMNVDREYSFKKTNFQAVRFKYEKQEVTFFYYRGIQKDTSKKKRAIKNSNVFYFVDDPVVDIGGKIDFFIIEDHIFIIDVRSFEYAFDYSTHVEKLRDEKLAKIIELPFFSGENSNKSDFENACKHTFYSRGLAQISEDTLSAIEKNFSARCEELRIVKKNIPENEAESEEYKKKFGVVWDLMDFIDIKEEKIKFSKEKSPKILIHFFADKIVKSFLTEDIKVALAYNN